MIRNFGDLGIGVVEEIATGKRKMTLMEENLSPRECQELPEDNPPGRSSF